jgi:hypothetical protein
MYILLFDVFLFLFSYPLFFITCFIEGTVCYAAAIMLFTRAEITCRKIPMKEKDSTHQIKGLKMYVAAFATQD